MAVTLAVWSDENDPAVKPKLALFEPAGITTEEGACRTVELELSATIAPPAAAAPLKVAVHVDAPDGFSDAGLQEREVTDAGAGAGAGATTLIMPSAADDGIALPVDEVATGFVIAIAAVVAFDASVTFTTAATPFPITFAFTP